MYAIAEINGKQYKIEKNATINVDKIASEEKNITIDKVLLFADGDNVMVGQPYLTNVKIKAEVLNTLKGEKVLGIKFKKRKNYTKTIGHRPEYSRIKIQEISLS